MPGELPGQSTTKQNKLNIMEKYSHYCTRKQAQRALKLGAPLEDSAIELPIVTIRNCLYTKPTTQQMIGWLREKGIFITFNEMLRNNCKYSWHFLGEYSGRAQTYEEAEYKAINAALTYLEKKGE